MKLLACLPLLLLASMSKPMEREAQIAPGSFRDWMPQQGSTHWVSDGVRVDIAPAPCTRPPSTEGCRGDLQNNRAEIVVTQTGRPPFRVLSDGQASYYRVAVVRFNRRDRRPGIVIENDSGGSAGNVREQLLVPEGGGYRVLWLPEGSWGELQGSLGPSLTDVSGDGNVDFILGDGRFAYAFGCNACTPRPPRIFTLREGTLVDVSRERPYAAVYRAGIARLRPICVSERSDRNGACAAYAAEAARIGMFESAWPEVQRHWEHQPDDLKPGNKDVESLRAYLRDTGYID